MNKKIKYNGGLVDIDVYNEYTTVYWHNSTGGYSDPKSVGRVDNSDSQYTKKLADLINSGKFEIDNIRRSEVLAKQRLEEASVLANQVIEGESLVEKEPGKPVYVPVKRRRGFFSALRDARRK